MEDVLEVYTRPYDSLRPQVCMDETSRQCLDRRVPDFQTLKAEARAWQERRDEKGGKIEWRFRTDDARIKLKRLYPSLQE